MLGWHTLIATQNNNEPITFYLFYLLTFSVKFLPSHKKVFCTWTFVQLCHWWRNGWRHRAHSTHYVVFSSTGAEHSRASATGTVLEKLHIILLKAILRLIVLIPCWCDKQTTQRSLKLNGGHQGHLPEDAYNFLTETHSVSDWAASQFKHDHYGVSLYPAGVRVCTQCTQGDTSKELHCLVSRKDCLGNKQTVRADKMGCSCGCSSACAHITCVSCVNVQKKTIHWCSWAQCIV